MAALHGIQPTTNIYLQQHLLSKAALVTDANTFWMFNSYLHHDPLMDDSSQNPFGGTPPSEEFL